MRPCKHKRLLFNRICFEVIKYKMKQLLSIDMLIYIRVLCHSSLYFCRFCQFICIWRQIHGHLDSPMKSPQQTMIEDKNTFVSQFLQISWAKYCNWVGRSDTCLSNKTNFDLRPCDRADYEILTSNERLSGKDFLNWHDFVELRQ